MKRLLKKSAAVLLAVIMMMSVMLTAPVTVNSAETRASKTQQEALAWLKNNADNNKALDYDGAYGAQCVDLIAYYLNYLGMSSLIGGNAKDYINKTMPSGSGWTKYKYTSGFVPKPGDICVWGANATLDANGYWTASEYGHIGVVYSVGTSTFTAVEQNVNGKQYCQYVSNRAISKVNTYIRPNFGTVSPYNIAYNANGGSGSISSSTVAANGSFTVAANSFTKSDHYFAGYNVYRKSDSTWYVAGQGWLSETAIRAAGYTKKVYSAGQSYTLDSSWTNGAANGDTYTFYPIWKPDNPTLYFYPNYSGCNYILGGGLDSNWSKYIYSRDTSVYTLSVDSTQRLNNKDSLKITAASAGASGKDLQIRTSTNAGRAGGGNGTYDAVGDNRKMTLTFWAKASVSGAKMYLRYGYDTSYKNVTLTTEWKKYTVEMTKNIYSGWSIHPYFDKAGTFWINNLTLCDGTNGKNNQKYEDGYTVTSQAYTPGGYYSTLPVPQREGYTFLGWFTQSEGGTQITETTSVNDYNMNVYAHWQKDITDTPAQVVNAGDKRYELYDNSVTWEQAKELCEQKGGHLVTINSQEENQLVCDMIKGGCSFAWLGGSMNDGTKEFEWVTGEGLEYTNWYTGEPDANNSEYYMMMYPMDIGTANSTGCWNDCNNIEGLSNYYSYGNSVYVCEYEPGETVVIEPSYIELSETAIDLLAGDSTNLIATVYPADADDKAVDWSSSDTSVAEVDSSGFVTAISAGTAEITAKTANGITASCTVNVWDTSESKDPIIKVETVAAAPDSEVTVDIYLINNPGFGGMVYDVVYDSENLELVSYAIGLGASICTDSGKDRYTGKVNLQYSGTSNIEGDGLLAEFIFKVKSTASGNFASVSVLPESGTFFTYDDRTEVDFTVDCIDGGVEIVDYIKGDVNGDGKVNNRDAARLLQMLAGWDVYYVEAALDVTGDGKVNNRDAARIMQYCAGWDVILY